MGGPMHIPARHWRFPLVGACASLFLCCSTFQSATAPAPPLAGDTSTPGQIPDSLLREAIRQGDLIVLATPVDMVSEHGFLTPSQPFGKLAANEIVVQYPSVTASNSS